MRTRVLAMLCAASLVFSSVPAGAAVDGNMGLEEVMFADIPTVFAASRRDEKFQLAASNLTVITADQIKAWGLRDLKDVLRIVPGYSVLYDRDEWVLSSRGLTSDNTTKFTLAIDGNIVNLLSGFGISNLMDVPNDLSNVKQIEIIRGPGSISWGNNASAGVINLVTKNAADLKKPHNLEAKVGTQRTYVQSFQFGQTKDSDVDMVLSGTVAQSDGRVIGTDASGGANINPIVDIPIPQEPGSGNGSRGRFTTALDRIAPSYRFHAKGSVGDIKLNGFVFSNRNYNRQFEIGKSREFWISREQMYLAGEWNKKAFNDRMDVVMRLMGGSGEQTYDPEDINNPLPIAGVNNPGHSISQDRRVMTASIEGSMRFLDDALKVTVGVDDVERRLTTHSFSNVNFDHIPSTFNNTSGGSVRYNSNDSTIGVYESVTISPAQNLHFLLGARSDHNASRGSERKKWIHTPRAAAMWEMSPDSVVKLIYNKGFLRPDANQVASKPNLVPEEISQTDLIFIHRMGRTNLTTTLFHQEAKDVLFLGEGSVGSANTINGQHETSRGVEVEMTGMMGQHRVFAAGHYFQNYANTYPPLDIMVIDNRRFDEGDDKLAAFTTMFNAGVAFQLAERLSVAPMARYFAPVKYRQTAVPTGSPVSVAQYKKTDAIIYLDMNINWDLSDALGFSVYGNNILNNRDELPHAVRNASYEPYGRYVEGKVSLHW